MLVRTPILGTLESDGRRRESPTIRSRRILLIPILFFIWSRDGSSFSRWRCNPSPSAGRSTTSPKSRSTLVSSVSRNSLPVFFFFLSRATCRPCRPQRVLGVLLCGIRHLLGSAARHCAACPPRRSSPIYGVVVLTGVVRAFNGPVTRAILPQLIPGGAFRQRRCLEFQRKSECEYSRPFHRRIRLRLRRGPSSVYAVAMIAGAVADHGDPARPT